VQNAQAQGSCEARGASLWITCVRSKHSHGMMHTVTEAWQAALCPRIPLQTHPQPQLLSNVALLRAPRHMC
jgi:hypothetical protein